MPRGLKIISYVVVAFVSFIVFLYFTFPFDVLKDRILADVEKGLKDKYEITVVSVSPRLIAGVTLKNVKVSKRDDAGLVPVWEADKVGLKISLLSLAFGNLKVKFDIKSGGGEITGRVEKEKNVIRVLMKLDDFDVDKITYLSSQYGLHLKSKINADIDLNFDPAQIIRSVGTFKMELNSIEILASKVKAGAMGEVDLPAMTIGAGGSQIAAELNKGAIKISSFKLEKGDLNLDIDGDIYLASTLDNFRLNLKGNFAFSDKIVQALPFLFIIEKQKSKEGTFPVTISGRLVKPQIKIGDFTLPF